MIKAAHLRLNFSLIAFLCILLACPFGFTEQHQAISENSLSTDIKSLTNLQKKSSVNDRTIRFSKTTDLISHDGPIIKLTPVISYVVPEVLDQSTAPQNELGFYFDIYGHNFNKNTLNLFYSVKYLADNTTSPVFSYDSRLLELISPNQIRVHGIRDVAEDIIFRFVLATSSDLQNPDLIVSNIAEITVLSAACTENCGSGTVSGELKKWHKTTITFDGPNTDEQNPNNPFLNYRLTVNFTSPSGETFTVPGYYAADGNAGETSSNAGNKWRVHFLPNEEGVWNYTASFREGTNIFIDENPNAGTPTSFDQDSGTFTIAANDKTGSDFRAKGLLKYFNGSHHLQFEETGEHFLKIGADSPENFLGYYEFDNTQDYGGQDNALHHNAWQDGLHHFEPHANDWSQGDPTWKNNKGKNIIGALNYLASKKINSVYFLTMNVNGDGREVYPWTNYNERQRFDTSKLDQWEVVFEHMQSLGIMMHVVLQETENVNMLDSGNLGLERKLYYKYMIARFAHHPALQWNLSEEDDRSIARIKEDAEYFKTVDPYKHFVVTHTFPNQVNQQYTPLLGYEHFDGPSLQIDVNTVHNVTKQWLDASAASGKTWVVNNDEQIPAGDGTLPDSVDPNHDVIRKEVLWGNLMAGGGGVEYYFGYDHDHTDLDCEDWRSRENMWNQSRYAYNFFQDNLPFADMIHCDQDLSGAPGYCLKKEGEVHVVYLKNGGNVDVNLPTGLYEVKWFNPRTGIFSQQVDNLLSSGGFVSLGESPFANDSVALITAPACTPGETRDCPLQEGVCEGVQQTCSPSGFWEACNYGSNYEQSETMCLDNLDNDCDGNIDSDDANCNTQMIWIPANDPQSATGMFIDQTYTSDTSIPPDADVDSDSLVGEMLYADSLTDSLTCTSNETASYVINIEETDTYYLWGRLYYPSLNSNPANSFCVSVDNGVKLKFGNNKDFVQKFHWDGNGNIENGAVAPLNLGVITAGVHTLKIHKREALQGPAPRVDVLLLTNDAEVVPSDSSALDGLSR